jgi:hypothetical protein
MYANGLTVGIVCTVAFYVTYMREKIKKMRDIRVASFYMTYMQEKIQTLRKIVYQKVLSQK